MYRIAVLRESGLGGGPPDLREAVEWYEKAAALGHDAAVSVLNTKRFELAWQLENEGRLVEAMDKYKLAADSGHALAKSLLPQKIFLRAEQFEREHDLPKAVDWYKKAASAGHRDAKLVLCQKQYELGKFYEATAVAQADEAERTASHGQADDSHGQADDSAAADNFRRAMELFAKAAAGGLPNGRALLSCKQYEMGLRCLRGAAGVPQSSGAALKWLEQAAEKGHELAMMALVSLCGSDDSAECDYSATAKWAGVLGAKGHMPAQYLMGVIAESGRGISKDVARAAKWYELAAEQGHAGSAFLLGCWYYSGYGVDSANHKIALGWFRRAAALRNADATFNLGVCLELGVGGQVSLTDGVEKYKEAAKTGHLGAM